MSDALPYRHLEGGGCFWSCRDCRLLREVGPPSLPTVEAIILQEVLPYHHRPTECLERKFPGLLSLLATYFAVGKDAADERVFEFFRRLYGSPRVEAMRAVNIVWLQGAPTEPLPEPLMVAVRELAEHGTGEVGEAARWLLERAAEDSGRPEGWPSG